MGNGAYGADSKLIDSLPSLEIIASHSVGLDQIDLVGCREKGIRVTYTPDILTDEVTNLEILLVLATLRKIYKCVCYVRSGLWIKNGDFKLTTKVSCGSRSIRLRSKNSAKVKEWVTAINEVALWPLEGWCHPHRFGSYAPPRGLTEDGSHAQWFVDGRAAFEPIALAIEGAKSEIFICGWWVCPELYLRRPFHAHASSRLDALLESKAKEGVQDLDLSVDLSAASAAAP